MRWSPSSFSEPMTSVLTHTLPTDTHASVGASVFAGHRARVLALASGGIAATLILAGHPAVLRFTPGPAGGGIPPGGLVGVANGGQPSGIALVMCGLALGGPALRKLRSLARR